MMFDIAWHEETYKNWATSIEREKIRLKDLQIKLENEIAELAFYQMQISAAKQKGKEGFDKYKFLIKKESK